ncbi:MAG: ABC transporter substrate-binding protein [Coriobacteriia bacterium]|nr:ABC transporter substrate-binding protein [Coriobacteriia bacterium]
MTSRRWAVLLCAVAVALMFAGCSAGDDTVADDIVPATGGPAFANVEVDEIVIGVVNGGEALSLAVADKSGLFSQAGVAATIIHFESAAERDAALAAGEVDAIVCALDDAAALEAAGTPVAVVSLLVDPADAGESTQTPGTADSVVGFGLTGACGYLVVSDYYIALPSGLLATRAVLDAADAAVVRIQDDPGAQQAILAEMVPGEVAVAGGAYPPSTVPGVTEIQDMLATLAAARPELAQVTADDLVLDIGR